MLAAALAVGACGGGSDDGQLASSSVTTTTTTAVEAVTTSTAQAAPTTVAAPATTTARLTATTRPATTAPPPPTAAATTAPPPSQPPRTAALTIQNFAFSPAALQVAANTTVTVTNRDAANHTWTADGGQWNSGSLGLNDTYRHTFTAAGTYSYRCDIHPSMKGTVSVS